MIPASTVHSLVPQALVHMKTAGRNNAAFKSSWEIHIYQLRSHHHNVKISKDFGGEKGFHISSSLFHLLTKEDAFQP